MSVLGQGGMGTVWRAEDEVLGRQVAVKELRFSTEVDDDERHRLVTRTLTEAKAIARIRHVGAVTVFDVVEEDGRPWIVMELVDGRSLSEVIRRDGVLTPRRAAEVALELLSVLAEAHRSGIVHRDVKPSNVLIGADGRVVLTDFGIARVEGDPSVTSTGMLVGAPSYISPERARGRAAGAASDMWSLGGTLYAMVEGHPPYDKGSALSTLTAVMTEEPEPPRRADLLAPVIAGLLRKDPEQRLDAQTAQAMLRAVLGEYERRERTTTTAPLPQPERTLVESAPARPSRKPLLVLAVVLAAVLVTVAFAAIRHHRKQADAPSGAAAATATARASASRSGSSDAAGADAGYREVAGPGGSHIQIPLGWTLESSSATAWKYRGPAGVLDLEFTPTPLTKLGALGAWQQEEPHVAGTCSDYRRIELKQVAYRGWDAADWQWVCGSHRALNRGFVVDASHGYAIYWTAPALTWESKRNQELLRRFFSSFRA
ncbi:serine/threonine-protein kinase [Streptacidiphilus monticola]|uniref:non-specific serine/threonine protein kinase n=1 Tax=Streptacidiphilus monticola TaxID=2161674 RepID=A0ABW1FXE6_9ACTN